MTEPADGNWHDRPADAVLKSLAVDPSAGLRAGDVARRQQESGPNALPRAGTRAWYRVFAGQFSSALVAILAVEPEAALAASRPWRLRPC